MLGARPVPEAPFGMAVKYNSTRPDLTTEWTEKGDREGEVGGGMSEFQRDWGRRVCGAFNDPDLGGHQAPLAQGFQFRGEKSISIHWEGLGDMQSLR